MRLWRLSSDRRARDFAGGDGLLHSGRWNSSGRAVTYCSTVPSLTALEKRVHVIDANLLPPQAMVEYDAPNDIAIERIEIDRLPIGWTADEFLTQQLGDAWLHSTAAVLLVVPSVIVPLASAPARNVLINHPHRAAA